MGRASATVLVPLAPEEAYDLWTDVARWPTFVDGFSRAERLDDGWPEEGAKLVWKSVPGGRGVVTERAVTAQKPHKHATDVFEEKLDGTQTVTFEPAEGGTIVRLQLDYTVSVGGPLKPIVDTLFIRRAQNDALARTLRRFATEAAEEAEL
jgi:uncharacterized membrane protein